MTHTCKALVFHCIDFRFGKAIKKYLEENNLLGNCDIIAVAGAAKNIVASANDADRMFILKQIELSKSLHNIKEVILINHTDCGAYGGRKAFPSRAEEENQHFMDMKKAADIIRAKYPDLRIKSVLANIEDSGEIHFDTGRA